MSVREAKTCRVCGSTNLYPYLDLGEQPLANAYRDPADTSAEFRAPLAIQACRSCGLSQLTHVVAPEMLYSRYHYYSGVSATWQAHCAALANEWARADQRVLEIASNDGTLLLEFEKRGTQVLGVEPASNFLLCGYPIVSEFWSAKLAEAFAGSMDLVLATNVLGHVDDAHDFMAGVATVLKPAGRAIIEVPLVMELLKQNAFDTIYHEHLSYWSLQALDRLARAHGFYIQQATPLAVHGGSVRIVLGRAYDVGRSVWERLAQEHRNLLPREYDAFSERVSALIAQIDEEMPTIAYSAPAKATVLLNMLSRFPNEIYDDTPAKQGKLVPGTPLVIQAPSSAFFKHYTEMTLFAWNWADELRARARTLGFAGRFFVPLPKPQWLNHS